jgi:hypothetical protein
VSLGDLPEQVLRFVLGPYLVTVGSDQTSRTTSVSVDWQDDVLVAGIGARTAVNLRANSAVTLLWPALVPGQHALIVDGWAELREAPDERLHVLIHPERAVLHVTRGHVQDNSARSAG